MNCFTCGYAASTQCETCGELFCDEHLDEHLEDGNCYD